MSPDPINSAYPGQSPFVTRADDSVFQIDMMQKHEGAQDAMGGRSIKVQARITVPKNGELNEYYHVVDHLSKRIQQGYDVNETFEFKGKRYRVVPKRDAMRAVGKKLESFNLHHFLHSSHSTAIKKYELQEDKSRGHFLSDLSNIVSGVKHFLGGKKTEKESAAHESEELPSIELQDEWWDNSFDVFEKVDAFHDPFTQIASLAFQKYEPDYRAHDYQKPGEINSRYAVVFDSDMHALKLVPKEELLDIDNRQSKLALVEYYSQIINEYGREKVDYVQYKYGINFLEMMKHDEPLTPEHIYRMNIGVSNIESHDLEELLCKMKALYDLASNAVHDRRVEGLSLQECFKEWKKEVQGKLFMKETRDEIWSNREIRGLIQLIEAKQGKETATVADFIQVTKPFMEALDQSLSNRLLATKMQIMAMGAPNEQTLDSLFAQIKEQEEAQTWHENEIKPLIDFVAQKEGNMGKPTVGDFLNAYGEIGRLRNQLDKLSPLEKAEGLKQHIETIYGDHSAYQQLLELTARVNGSSIEDLTVSDFLDSTNDPIRQISASTEDGLEMYNQILSVFRPDDQAMERAYTGRKIEHAIASEYKTADKNYYKPWIDQQENLQIFRELEADTIYDPYQHVTRSLTKAEKWERFDEACAFCLCKKHLFRPHPTDGLRVGALIPAPSDDAGNKRWYRVAQMTANNDGLLNYVLEPAVEEPLSKADRLTTYMMYRSTSSDDYQYQGGLFGETLLDDANPINSPGYEGRYMMAPYLDKIWKEHTVPVWVHYQHHADRLLKEENRIEANGVLKKANTEILRDLDLQNHKRSLHEIVKTYDAELNDLACENINWGSWLVSRFMRLGNEQARLEKAIYRQAHGYLRQGIEQEKPGSPAQKLRLKQEKKDALTILNYINRHGLNSDGKYQQLLNTVNTHVLSDQWKADYAHEKEQLKESILNQVVEYENRADAAIKDNDQESLQHILDDWSRALKNYAVEQGENIEVKKLGMQVTGHSLGASSSEVEFYMRTAGANRLPPPGAAIQTNLFDDPGMNAEDNQTMVEFAVRNAEILQANDSHLIVNRSQEKGDFVPLGSERHLGAAHDLTEEETKAFKRGLEVTSRIQSATPYSLNKEVLDVSVKHATRFSTGKEEKTAILNISSEVLRKSIPMNDKVYINYIRTLMNPQLNTQYPSQVRIDDFEAAFGKYAENPIACLEIFSRVKNAHADSVINDSLLREEAERYDGVESEEVMRYSTLREEVKRSLPLDNNDRQFLQAADREFKAIFNNANKVREKNRATEYLEGSDLTLYLVDDEVYAKILGENDPGKRLGQLMRLPEVTRYSALVQLQKDLKSSKKRNEKALTLQLNKARESGDHQKIKQIKEEMRVIKRSRDSISSAEKKEMSRLKKRRGKSYEMVMGRIKDLYHRQVEEEANISHSAALGDKKVTYVDEKVLAAASGVDSADRNAVNKTWGVGLIGFSSKQAETNRKFTGRHILPIKTKDSRRPQASDERARKVGQGRSFEYQNPSNPDITVDMRDDNRVLAVDLGGVLSKDMDPKVRFNQGSLAGVEIREDHERINNE